MYNKILFVLIVLFSCPVFATPVLKPMQVQFAGKQYELTFSDGQLFASGHNKMLKGELEKQAGDFSQWMFKLNEQTGFDIIINQKNRKIIFQKNSLDAGGPFLQSVSSDAKYIVLDYGTAPTKRDFEVRTDKGKIIFKNTYLNVLNWKKDGLEYDHPTSLPLNHNQQTEACRDLGAAWQVQMYVFDGKKNKKLATPARIECSN